MGREMARAEKCCLFMEIRFVNCLWVQQGAKPVEKRAGNKRDLSDPIRGALVHTRAGGCWEQGLSTPDCAGADSNRVDKTPLLPYNTCNRTKGRICTRELQQ